MQNVWKIGSNWGDGGPSILDLFLDYECVFFGSKHDSGIGDYGNVRNGDLLIVADGSVPVAIGVATGTFKSYAECGIRFRKKDADDFIDDDVAICPARLVLLTEEERGMYWGMETRRRFCRAGGAAEKVRSWWAKHEVAAARNPFAIRTRVASLLVKGENDNDTLIQDNNKYHVPIYQRPYSWGEPELRRLMEDLHQCVNSAKGCESGEDAFLGTVQLSQPVPLKPDGSIKSYDVIDGQQRLTTFILLLVILETATTGESKTLIIAKSNLRTSVNRRTAQDDLEAAFDFFDKGFPGKDAPVDTVGNPYIDNARILDGLLHEFASRRAEGDDADDDATATEETYAQYAKKLLAFIEKQVKFVVLETHAGLSKTLKIFNTINSTGLDLGSEDLFKVRFYEYLKRLGAADDVFDRISELYGRIDDYNRHPFLGARLSMSQVLASYQRVLIARCDLNAALFSMSQETFFEGVFDTSLNIRVVPEFKVFSMAEQPTEQTTLSLKDLTRIFESHVDYLDACSKDSELRIARSLLWETRYGYASDFPVLAMVKGIATPQTVKKFAMGLFKAVVPASLYFAKHVYHGRACLLDLLKGVWKGDFGESDSVVAWAQEKWRFDGLDAKAMLKAALDYSIAWTPKWKNLLCRLAEFVMSPQKDDSLFKRLFQTGFDIEHIQSRTDENTPDETRSNWGDEINKLGNLAMFEACLNRSVHNHLEQKAEAYGKSAYVTIREIQPKICNWTKSDAIDRKEKLSASIVQFLLSE